MNTLFAAQAPAPRPKGSVALWLFPPCVLSLLETSWFWSCTHLTLTITRCGLAHVFGSSRLPMPPLTKFDAAHTPWQRMLVLDALTAAAHEMANPEMAPELRLQGGASDSGGVSGSSSAPTIKYPTLGKKQSSAGKLTLESDLTPYQSARGPKGGTGKGSSSSNGGSGGQDGETRTRIWGPVALRKLGEAAPKTYRNAFADVALRWAGGLLRQVQEEEGKEWMAAQVLLLILRMIGS